MRAACSLSDVGFRNIFFSSCLLSSAGWADAAATTGFGAYSTQGSLQYGTRRSAVVHIFCRQRMGMGRRVSGIVLDGR